MDLHGYGISVTQAVAEIERNPDLLNQRKSVFGCLCTPLHAACLDINFPLIQELVRLGANVNCKTDGGFTPLMYLCNAPKATNDMIEFLLTSGADLEEKNYEGNTALMIAINKGRISVAQLLISWGADASTSNHKGIGALDNCNTAARQRLEAAIEDSQAYVLK